MTYLAQQRDPYAGRGAPSRTSSTRLRWRPGWSKRARAAPGRWRERPPVRGRCRRPVRRRHRRHGRGSWRASRSVPRPRRRLPRRCCRPALPPRRRDRRRWRPSPPGPSKRDWLPGRSLRRRRHRCPWRSGPCRCSRRPPRRWPFALKRSGRRPGPARAVPAAMLTEAPVPETGGRDAGAAPSPTQAASSSGFDVEPREQVRARLGAVDGPAPTAVSQPARSLGAGRRPRTPSAPAKPSAAAPTTTRSRPTASRPCGRPAGDATRQPGPAGAGGAWPRGCGQGSRRTGCRPGTRRARRLGRPVRGRQGTLGRARAQRGAGGSAGGGGGGRGHR